MKNYSNVGLDLRHALHVIEKDLEQGLSASRKKTIKACRYDNAGYWLVEYTTAPPPKSTEGTTHRVAIYRVYPDGSLRATSDFIACTEHTDEMADFDADMEADEAAER